jgi:hypothetical protein
MKGTDYNVALMVFFVPYVLFEVPSNMLLAKFKRPSYYMGILVRLSLQTEIETHTDLYLHLTGPLLGYRHDCYGPGAEPGRALRDQILPGFV